MSNPGNPEPQLGYEVEGRQIASCIILELFSVFILAKLGLGVPRWLLSSYLQFDNPGLHITLCNNKFRMNPKVTTLDRIKKEKRMKQLIAMLICSCVCFAGIDMMAEKTETADRKACSKTEAKECKKDGEGKKKCACKGKKGKGKCKGKKKGKKGCAPCKKTDAAKKEAEKKGKCCGTCKKDPKKATDDSNVEVISETGSKEVPAGMEKGSEKGQEKKKESGNAWWKFW